MGHGDMARLHYILNTLLSTLCYNYSEGDSLAICTLKYVVFILFDFWYRITGIYSYLPVSPLLLHQLY